MNQLHTKIQLQNPYLSEGFTWLRGNLHGHTTFSDGEAPPEAVIAAYDQQGCDFLAISDHDVLGNPGEYQSLTRMALIGAQEVTARGPHMLAIHIRSLVEPSADRQKAIDDINSQGGLAILNHPNWQRTYNHFPQELMEALTGYAGIEIYNGVVERLHGSALATDRWDQLLSVGRHVWGYAHDDSHRPLDIGRAWNVVQAQEPTADKICESLRLGRFYASTGVDISEIGVQDETIVVTAPNAQCIRFIGDSGRELQVSQSNKSAYKVTGEEGGYMRAECFGEGMKMAWTQPFFFTTGEVAE